MAAWVLDAVWPLLRRVQQPTTHPEGKRPLVSPVHHCSVENNVSLRWQRLILSSHLDYQGLHIGAMPCTYGDKVQARELEFAQHVSPGAGVDTGATNG